MNGGPQRYAGQGPCSVALSPAGSYVLFADVEGALQDSERLAWLMPVLTGGDDHVANMRTECLAAGLRIGLRDTALVDWAREGCPV